MNNPLLLIKCLLPLPCPLITVVLLTPPLAPLCNLPTSPSTMVVVGVAAEAVEVDGFGGGRTSHNQQQRSSRKSQPVSGISTCHNYSTIVSAPSISLGLSALSPIKASESPPLPVVCQLCFQPGHTATLCPHYFPALA